MDSIKIIKLDSITSTNDYLKQLALSGADEKTVVIANRQTAGKGTKNRSFISEIGGLYISILLRPEIKGFDATLITPAAAVAVSDTIDLLSGKNSQIKWVNDVYLNNKKVCGILCESVIEKDGNLPFIIVGIGVNLCVPQGGFAPEIAQIATSVFEECDEDLKQQFSEYLLSRFFEYYNNLQTKEFLQKYRQKNLVIGREITVCEYDKIHTAKAEQIDDNCRLVVSLSDGTIKTLSSGEVSLKL